MAPIQARRFFAGPGSSDLSEHVQVAFASGSEDLIPTLLDEMRQIRPDLPLYVVSEFPVPEFPSPEFLSKDGQWIPYHPGRSLSQNLNHCRWVLRDKKIYLAGLILQPRMPYWRLRLMAVIMGGWRTAFFNENLHHFMLRPRSLGVIARHLLWRGKNLVRWELRPGGAVYTFLWRLWHPKAFVRPCLYWMGRMAGVAARWRKSMRTETCELPKPDRVEPGISVIVPSRNGKHLLEELLPGLLGELAGREWELIVVDNGSEDGTADWLEQHYREVTLVRHPIVLSFSRAVNFGIARSRKSHVLMLNNDMVVEPGFFAALEQAFVAVPDLFCATAQILFPPGERRQETGKAVMPPGLKKLDFPVRCETPLEGEDHSYVLYGSGGCSLFDAVKLKQLGGLDEAYQPAYVEDLDLGYRGWQQGWPTVFVAGAKVVHKHRSTTSRYYSEEQLARVLEVNYLRFLAGTVRAPELFGKLWRASLDRLDGRASRMEGDAVAQWALRQSIRALEWALRPGSGPMLAQRALAAPPHRAGSRKEERILALCSGDVAVFPGQRRTGRPVVLVASPYLPFPLAHGGAVRMYNLMRCAAEEYDQVLISFADQLAQAPEELLAVCQEIVIVRRHGSHTRPLSARPDVVEEFDSLAFRAALRQSVRKWKPAVAQLEFTQMAQYAVECAPAPVILVEHDVTLDLYAQLLQGGEDWETRQQYERWVQFEQKAWGEVDVVVTMSEKDRRGVQGRRVECLPNGVDLERFRPASSLEAQRARREPPSSNGTPVPSGAEAPFCASSLEEEPEAGRILFIGSFAHLPNVLAVDFFLREVFPLLPLGKLHIIAGARHQYFLHRYQDRVRPNLEQPGVEVDDFVADPRPAYRRATVVVAPLLASAGTNIKVMEAMAMGKAVVSTPAGVNGLEDLRDGHDVVIAATGPEMARAIEALLRDRDLRRRIEQRARQTVEQRYGWPAIARRQRELYESLRASTA
ncbi:MAG: glycosyltransferase [Acidobacteriia bacterium]|nr:glycosyltransferase [Terriglobia bacterium]